MKTAIRTMANDKATGSDDISTEMLNAIDDNQLKVHHILLQQGMERVESTTGMEERDNCKNPLERQPLIVII